MLKGTHAEAPQITIHAIPYPLTHDSSLQSDGSVYSKTEKDAVQTPSRLNGRSTVHIRPISSKGLRVRSG